MVHLSPDGRLLASLIKQESTYATTLLSLLNASRSSLSALVIYASSSPPPISPTLKGVAGVLSGADDALRAFGDALGEWVDSLKAISEKEEEVANIGRDREILVTRLIKVTQKTKATPQSLLHNPSSSSLSFPSFNAKASAAQAELQACEAHLAEKERELQRFREGAIRRGLKIRCEAMVQCGRTWSEMGRRAVTMLDEMGGQNRNSNGRQGPNGTAYSSNKPLPNGHAAHNPQPDGDTSSALSSIAPSQSASQIGISTDHPLPVLPTASPPRRRSYSLTIPPAHQMTDIGIPGTSMDFGHSHPNGNAVGGDGADEEHSSSGEEHNGRLEVHENPRFSQNRGTSLLSKQTNTPTERAPTHFPVLTKQRTASSDVGPGPSPYPGHTRSASASRFATESHRGRKATSSGSGFFGSISALFKTSLTGKPTASSDVGTGGGGGSWSTRTDSNRADLNDSDSDLGHGGFTSRFGKLRKRKARGDVDSPTTLTPREEVDIRAFIPPGASSSGVYPHGTMSRGRTMSLTLANPSPSIHPSAKAMGKGTPSGIGSQRRRPVSLEHPMPSKDGHYDGRWSIASTNSRREAKRESLMSIVESTRSQSQSTSSPPTSHFQSQSGILHQPTPRHLTSADDPTSKLILARAPSTSSQGVTGYPPILIHHPPPLRPTSTPPLSVGVDVDRRASTSSSISAARSGTPPTTSSISPVLSAHSGNFVPAPGSTAAKPLRSALRRKEDRSVSPMPSNASSDGGNNSGTGILPGAAVFNTDGNASGMGRPGSPIVSDMLPAGVTSASSANVVAVSSGQGGAVVASTVGNGTGVGLRPNPISRPHIPSTIMELESPRASMLVDDDEQAKGLSPASFPAGVGTPSPQGQAPGQAQPRPNSPMADTETDTSSLSSYETGQENFYTDDEDASPSPPRIDGDGGTDDGTAIATDGTRTPSPGVGTPVMSSPAARLPGFHLGSEGMGGIDPGQLTPRAEGTQQLSVQAESQPQAQGPSVPPKSSPSPPMQAQPTAADSQPPTSQTQPQTQTQTQNTVTVSTSGSGDVPVRRKSVRLSSLPPQVLNRTPSVENTEFVFEDDDAPSHAHSSHHSSSHNHNHNHPHQHQATSTSASYAQSGGQGWQSRINSHVNIWDDSSEEDEDYSAARKALESMHRRGDADFGVAAGKRR